MRDFRDYGPSDPHERPCECCGRGADSCICPECPRCGVAGDPACYTHHGLAYSTAQLEGLRELREAAVDAEVLIDETERHW